MPFVPRHEVIMYHAIGLLQSNNDFSIAEAEARLKRALPDHRVIPNGNRIRVERGESMQSGGASSTSSTTGSTTTIGVGSTATSSGTGNGNTRSRQQ